MSAFQTIHRSPSHSDQLMATLILGTQSEVASFPNSIIPEITNIQPDYFYWNSSTFEPYPLDFLELNQRLNNISLIEPSKSYSVPRYLTTDVSISHADMSRAEKRLEALVHVSQVERQAIQQPLSNATVKEAGILLRKIAAANLQRNLPSIGLDTDGVLVFSFDMHRNSIEGSMSVFGDGTYSYYLEQNGGSISNSETKITSQLPAELLDFLME